MIQYFNLYCLYKTFIFKLYNGSIEIHRIFYRVYFSVLTVKITHLLRQIFLCPNVLNICTSLPRSIKLL